MAWKKTTDGLAIECHIPFGETTCGGNPIYWIPLLECQTADEALRWVGQIERKTWCDEECLNDLIAALTDYLRCRIPASDLSRLAARVENK